MANENVRYTVEGFINASRQVHGDKYDYSLVEYRNNKTPVTIICPVHGPFRKIPSDHLHGGGCRQCGRVASSTKQRKTTDQFLAEAYLVHGARYDYSEVQYLGNKVKVQIICPIHGVFEQTPGNHLAGKGCWKCAKEALSDSLRKTSEQFLAEAKRVHGDKYDYRKVVYQQARSKVEIVCPLHGPFWQTPDAHLRGAGCKQCANDLTAERFRMTQEEFIRRSIKQHGNKFDYGRIHYKTAFIPVEIHCPKHGSFRQAPVTHLRSVHGCPKCAHELVNQDRKLTNQAFLERAKAVHGDRYDYALVDCLDTKTDVTITCRKHGPFMQAPGEHLAGRGCKKCGNEATAAKQTMTQAEFLDRAMRVHGQKYNYSLLEYKSAKSKIKIICPVHGLFEQSAWDHLQTGCRKCTDEARPGLYTLKILEHNPELAAKPAFVYYLKFTSEQESFYKIGITLTTVSKRFAGYRQTGYNYSILKEKRTTLLEAYLIEKELLVIHKNRYAYRPINWENRRGKGSSECFWEPLPKECLRLLDD